ncbi:MAG TPA: PAS domain S-box protein, partial [Anaerolineae bacterium]|nr:PAS domain S-box protein [Anaerolineae bacterium]
MGEPIRVLIVEDSEDDGLLITRQLRKGGFDVQSLRVDTASSFTTALAAQSWDVVIADFSLPAFGGLEALRLLRESGQDIPFIIVSGTIGEDVAVAAMKAGAHDYVMKDDLARLVPAVRRELQEAEVRRARRRAEQALRESEEKYRSLFQNAYDAIFLMDEDIFVDCNPAAEEMFRCSKEEIVGHSPASLSPPRQPDGGDSRTKALKMIRAALTGTRQVFEWVHRRCDDSLFDAEVSLSRLFLGGKPMVLAIVRDVTERKRAEKMLRRRNRELTALYEIGRDISATLDLQTVLERIAMHARALLKADDSEVYLMDDDGETLRAIVALGEYAEHIKALPLRVGEGIVGYVAQSGVAEMVNRVDLDPRAVQVNGTPVEPQALICAPLTYQERVIGVISLARNESREPFEPADLNFLIGLSWQAAIAIENARMFAQEEQRVIELARALEKQRELDDLKDQLIQNVSHELRTPLGIIRGYAELLDTGELGELRPEQREPVAIIARRARMLGKLVSNLTTALEV